MSILLIRHGQTDLNAARVIQVPDTPLSKRGQDQARRLADRLAVHPIELILCSDYARARMTAEAVRVRTGAPLQITESLRERNFGDLRGTPYSELPTDVFAPHYEPPAGESCEVFHRRVALAWQEVASKARELKGDLAVVTHGLVCGSLVDRVLDRGAGACGDTPLVANTSLTIVDARSPWRIQRLACTEHLEGPEPDGEPRIESNRVSN